MLKTIDGKITHLKELAFIEKMLYTEVLSPEEYYNALSTFLKDNYDLAELTFWKKEDLERVDQFTKLFFDGKINESKIWLIRGYIVGRYLAQTDITVLLEAVLHGLNW
jgi:hypothetical protein